MYRMIIVDDEPSIRQGIRDSMNWALMEIEIVGEACNGLEAMLLIHDLDPDIAICDIHMPKLDGISLLNEVRPSHPNLQTVFLSGYSDTDYLKNAIKLDAVDYIFKPFQLHELVEALEKAKRNCLRSRASVKGTDPDIALELLRYREGQGLRHDLPIDLGSTLITILIRFNSEFVDSDIYNSSFDTKLAASHYHNSFRSACGELFGDRFVMSYAAANYVIHANVDPNYLYRQSIHTSLAKLFDVIGGDRTAMTVGVSNLYSGIGELKGAFLQAREAVTSAFLNGYGRVLLFRDLSRKAFIPSARLQEEFCGNITGDNITAAVKFLYAYTEEMAACRAQDIPAIKDELVSIAFWINDRVKTYTGEERGFVTDRIHYASQIQSIRQYLMAQIDRYVEHISNLDNKGRIILEAERYVLQNYGSDLSIKAIANHVFITPNYLSFLYKKKTGHTLNKFILDVKMEHAKAMVAESDCLLGDIAEALGYQNQNYFAKIFTKYFGENPSQYRKRHGKTGGAG